jgi:two-component system cell cycle sensor histidine kinase PleC
MRSAETSGVRAKGFGAHKRARPRPLHGLGQALLRPFAFVGAHLSPVSLAIALTALAAAGLSVAVDMARTWSELQEQRQQIQHVATGEPVARWNYAGRAMTTLAGPLGGEDAYLGVMHRGAGAFGLALGVAALTLRRRRDRSDGAGPARARYDDLLATMPFGAACWTQNGRLVACNGQYLSCVGLGPGTLRPGASYHDSVKQLAAGGYMQLVSEDENNRLIELHREDGSVLMIDERPLSGGGFVTLVTDVTESRRTDDLLNTIREEQRQLARRYHEEKLRAEAASRAKTSFLAHLSHDIRTPLTHIIGFADVIRQETYGPLGDKRYAGYISDMRESGERLLTFFGSILELVELESGEKPLRAEPFVMDDMLVSIGRRYAAEAQRAGIALTLGAPCGAVLVGDRFALERMAGNIVENALRFTPAGGRIGVCAYAASDGVVLEISDTGVGMSEERLETLSQPFAFGDAALTRQHTGAGLGIAIARTIAELSGGRLAIDSRPSLGTTVAISLPLPAADAVRAA